MVEKSLYLHIGYGKTGTSALQNFFILNQSRLSSMGILYPTTGRGEVTAHHYLATAARPGGGTGYESDTSWEEYLEKLAREMEGRSEDKVLISSEVFSGRMTWSKLVQFEKLFCELVIVVYLRRQDDFLMSSYQQWIKTELLSSPLDEIEPLPINYASALKPWKNLVGAHKGRIIVRPYEKQQFHNGKLFDDFMFNVFGVGTDASYELPSRDESNPRLSFEALEFKRVLNGFCPRDIAADILPVLLSYSRESEEKREGGFWDGAVLSPRTRSEFLDKYYNDGNEKVAREFLGREDGRLFYDALAADEGDWEARKLTIEKAKEIGRYIMFRKYPGFKAFFVNRVIEKAAKAGQALKADDGVIIEAIVKAVMHDIYGDFQETTIKLQSYAELRRFNDQQAKAPK